MISGERKIQTEILYPIVDGVSVGYDIPRSGASGFPHLEMIENAKNFSAVGDIKHAKDTNRKS
jgi:hypothetical protein